LFGSDGAVKVTALIALKTSVDTQALIDVAVITTLGALARLVQGKLLEA